MSGRTVRNTRSSARRLVSWAALLLVGATALASCGSDASDSAATSSESPTTSDEAFPVTIEHSYGATEISEEPERIVTVGLTDHDAFLALGVVPVGVTDWYGDYPHAVWPWAQDELGDAEPVMVGNATELDFEKLAALEPDVIVGLYSALTEENYDTLSQIAPTVAQPREHVDYGIPWQELTLTAGRVAGEVEQAERLVAEIEDRFAEIRAEHPEFIGAGAAIATPYQGIYVYSADVANGRLLSSLGFKLPAELVDLIGDADGTNLSLERLDLLDVDALVWLDAAEGEGPIAQPLYEKLDVATEGREVIVNSASELGGAMSFSSVLSLPVLLVELAPMLEAAVDGDPATEVPTAP
ncbi:MAG: iron-siderophore ABC transporter substrate-binding protein [Actinomycetota bacterium]